MFPPFSRVAAIQTAWLIGTLLMAATSATAQVSVATQHNDAARTGANLSETTLTTLNVNVNQFGKLFEWNVDDQVYAQPLYVAGVNIPSVGVRNVVYIATVSDTVYAFDADDPNAAPLWSVSYVNPDAGIFPVSSGDVGQNCGVYTDMTTNIGIVGTPAIDTASATMYFVTRTRENGDFSQQLHAVDITNGSDRPGSPVVIQASVPGIGDGSDGANVPFNPQTENQRPGLLLKNGAVYIAWASHCDTGPYHGWIIGYDQTTLQQVMVYNSTPNGGLGGIWQSGQGLSADDSGNIFAVTGNGDFDGDIGGSSRGSSFVKISPAGDLLDWFTPFNHGFLDSLDLDLGLQGALLLPGTNLLVGGGKDGFLYVLNRDNFGQFQPDSNSQIVQSFSATAGLMFGSPVYWNGPGGPMIYVWPSGDPLKAFAFGGGLFQEDPVAQSAAVAPPDTPGGILSLSANGNTPATAILWTAVSNGSNTVPPQAGILRAYDASDITRELWNSEQNSVRDGLGDLAKFVPPTVANGKVYAATFSNKIAVYGLFDGTPVVSMSEPSDSGASQTFNYVFTDPNGFADISWTAMLVADESGGYCAVFFDRASGGLLLLNDGGTAWSGPAAVGSGGTLENSRCIVDATGSSASGQDTDLTVNLALIFKGAFAGPKTIFGLVTDNEAHSSNWQPTGTFTVTNAPPAVTSVTPDSGSGSSQTFSYLFTDPNGFADIAWTAFFITGNFSVPDSCVIYFDRATNGLLLLNDAASVWLGPAVVGSGGTLQNSQCVVDATGASVVGSGASTELTVNLPLTFKPSYAGAKTNVAIATDTSNQDSTWQVPGTWTVEP